MASEVIERSLYSGLVNLVHNPNARGRAPRYVATEPLTGSVTKPKGVTTILGGTLAKDFVGWALDCMEEYLQGKLPVITQEDLSEGKKESARRRDAGAGFGTEAHAMVERYLKGKPAGGGSPEATNAFNAFKAWFEAVTPEVVNVEEVIYSHKHKYAGTYDCMLQIDGVNYLCDLKTTNPSRKAPDGVYAENFIQLGAYAKAHEEQRKYEEESGKSELLPVDGLMVISAKKNGKLDIVTNDDVGLTVDTCADLFEQVLKLYNFSAETTRQLGGK
jgi:hypothetical protein